MSDDRDLTESLNIFRKSAQSHNKSLEALRAIQDTNTTSTPQVHVPAPVDEKHSRESAGVLVSRLASQLRQWQKSLSEDKEPIIVAVLANGTVIPVNRLESDGHHGLIIHGDLDDSPCMIIAHQSNLTLLCTTADRRSGSAGRKIAFYVDGKELSSDE